MRKKIMVGAFLLLGAFGQVEASRWRHQETIHGPGGCVEEHYACVSGFGFAFCEVGSTQVIITCPPH